MGIIGGTSAGRGAHVSWRHRTHPDPEHKHAQEVKSSKTNTDVNQHREERALVHEAHGPHPWLKTKRGERTHPPLALTDRALLRPLS